MPRLGASTLSAAFSVSAGPVIQEMESLASVS